MESLSKKLLMWNFYAFYFVTENVRTILQLLIWDELVIINQMNKCLQVIFILLLFNMYICNDSLCTEDPYYVLYTALLIS